MPHSRTPQGVAGSHSRIKLLRIDEDFVQSRDLLDLPVGGSFPIAYSASWFKAKGRLTSSSISTTLGTEEALPDGVGDRISGTGVREMMGQREPPSNGGHDMRYLKTSALAALILTGWVLGFTISAGAPLAILPAAMGNSPRMCTDLPSDHG